MTLLDACVVCLQTKKMITKHRITSLQEPEYSLIKIAKEAQISILKQLVITCFVNIGQAVAWSAWPAPPPLQESYTL